MAADRRPCAGVLVLALSVAAYAAYRYDQRTPAGSFAAPRWGVNVSEMTRREAVAAVWARAGWISTGRSSSSSRATLHDDGEAPRPPRLGRQAVDEAMEGSERLGWVDARGETRDEPTQVDIELSFGGDRGVHRFVRRTAREVSVTRAMRPSVSGGRRASFRRSSRGGADARRAERRLTRRSPTALRSFGCRAPRGAQDRRTNHRTTIVVHVDTNRLVSTRGSRSRIAGTSPRRNPGGPHRSANGRSIRSGRTPGTTRAGQLGRRLPAVVPGGPGTRWARGRSTSRHPA